jgi:hypothetical protein
MKRNTLPKALHRYFWDVDAKQLNIRKYRQFVIERILEFGDERAIRWVRRAFGDDAIRQVVCQSRRISKRTANFWCLLLNIPKEKVACLFKRSRNPLKNFWFD